MISDVEMVARIGVAAVAGGILGLERELNRRTAGLRTHALVAVGAASFSLAGAYGFADIRSVGDDPMRVAAQVVTGIGFVGAGAVLRSGGSVRGLTTASSLWVCGAVGVGAAAGLYAVVVATVLIALTILAALRLLPRVHRQDGGVTLSVEYDRGYDTLGRLLHELEVGGCSVRAVHVADADGQAEETRDRVDVDVAGATSAELALLLRHVLDGGEIRRASFQPADGPTAHA